MPFGVVRMLPEILIASESAAARALTLEELVEETKRLLGCRLSNSEKISRLKRLLSVETDSPQWKHANGCPEQHRQQSP